MISKSLKNSIIQDYICLNEAIHFCENCQCLKLQEIEKQKLISIKIFALDLLQIYKKIMFKLNLINLSTAVLEKEIKSSQMPFGNFSDNINQVATILKSLGKNLIAKIHKMKLNTFELNYLNINNLSKFINLN